MSAAALLLVAVLGAPQVESEPQAEPAPAAEPDPAPQADPSPQAEPSPEAEPAPAVEATSETEADPEPEPDPEPDVVDDVILIIDDESAAGEESPAPTDDVVITIGDPADSEPSSEPTAFDASRTWATAEISSRLQLDTSFSKKTGEDVVEWWNLGRLTVDHRRDQSLRIFFDGWARWGVMGEDTKPHNPFLLVNAADPKWTGDVQLREGWLSYRSGPLELAAGARIYVWGKNEIQPAADVLNPVDLRFEPLRALTSTKDIKIPIFAVDAAYWHGDSSLQLVFAPFFQRHQIYVVGNDFAVAAPGSELEAQINDLGRLAPSVEDQFQDGLTGTDTPDESPDNATVALRGTTRVAGWDLAATGYWGWDRTPRVRIDPDLAILALEADRILADPQLVATDPVLRDALLNVQQKSAMGQELLSATYQRMWRFALEAEGVVGDFVLRADAGFSPEQLYYDEAFNAYDLPTWMGSAGAEWTQGQEWFVQLTAFSTAVINAPNDAVLLGFEREKVDPATRDTAVMWGGALTARYLWEEQNLEVQAAALLTVEPGDRVGTLQISYRDFEPHEIQLGVVLVDGEAGAIGHRYRGNDFAYLQYASTW